MKGFTTLEISVLKIVIWGDNFAIMCCSKNMVYNYKTDNLPPEMTILSKHVLIK